MKEIPVDKNNNSFHREGLWMETYGLIRSQSYGRITGCLRPIARKRCTKLNPQNACDGCIDQHRHDVVDHGHYYRVPNTDIFIFYAQPYNTSQEAVAYLTKKAAQFGLYVHVGGAGEAWWHPTAQPVIISRTAIPEHRYRQP